MSIVAAHEKKKKFIVDGRSIEDIYRKNQYSPENWGRESACDFSPVFLDIKPVRCFRWAKATLRAPRWTLLASAGGGR